MSRFIPIRLGAAIAGLAALTVAMLPGLAAADIPSAQVPDDLKAAIEQYIEGQGHEYAGLCVDVNANPGSIVPGTYCAGVGSIEHEIAEVGYGPVLSDDISLVSFQLRNGQWTVMDSTTPTPTTPASPTSPSSPSTPRPPATGNGSSSDSTDGVSPAVLLVGGLAAIIALSTVGMAAASKR